MRIFNGKKYVAVNRKAEMGEKILIDRNEMHHDLIIGSIYEMGRNGNINSWYVENEDGSKRDYVVLEPLESEAEITVDTSQASEQVIEMFAALSRKIVSLERQLADTQRNVERQAEELENAKHRISKHAEMVEMLTDDVITLDERTQVINAITKFYGGERR